jgi:predicted SAM-dependent methyltransferase
MKKLFRLFKFILLGNKKSEVYTSINYEKPYVHLGCGEINLKGWINIDARPSDHVHLVTNKIDLNEFADESIGVIYLSHVLEHFDLKEVEGLLNKFYSKLKKGGVLLIAVPDFKAIALKYVENNNLLLFEKALVGGQDYEYNYHKSVYDYQLLKHKLNAANFSEVLKYDTVHEFGLDIGDFSTYKVDNTLISLNVKAFKI